MTHGGPAPTVGRCTHRPCPSSRSVRRRGRQVGRSAHAHLRMALERQAGHLVAATTPGEFVGRERVGEQETLALVAAQLHELFQLPACLNALADHRHPKLMSHNCEALNNRPVALRVADLSDEAAVNLQNVHVQTLKVSQHRVTGPEVVQGQVNSETRQLSKVGLRVLRVAYKGCLGDLEADSATEQDRCARSRKEPGRAAWCRRRPGLRG